MKIFSQFLEIAISKLSNYAISNEMPTDFVCPDHAIIREIIETSYLASLYQEEGRIVKFKITYFSNSRIPSDFFNYLYFSQGIEFTSKNLFKLSMALNYTSSQIILERKNGKLYVSGIQTLGSDLEKTYSHDRAATILPSDLFTCCVSGPGKMIVMIGINPLVAIDKDEIKHNSPYIFQEIPFQKSFSQALSLAKNDLNSKAINFEILELWKLFVPFLDNLLRCVLKFSHGGTIVFLPQLNENQRIDNFASIKYSVGDLKEKFWENFLSYLENYSHILDPENYPGENATLNYNREKIRIKLLDLTEFLARLTQVDGALLLSKTFQPLGFGAEIELKADLPNVRVIKNESGATDEIDPSFYGTRHRSAFRLVNLLSDSLVFVFSTDGSIKAIFKDDQRTLLLSDVNKTKFESVFGL